MTRRVALFSFLVPPLAAGVVSLAGCGGEKEVPVIPSSKGKDDLQSDIENPYGGQTKKGKPKRKQ